MKKAQIVIGGVYEARVSGHFVQVRVDGIRERDGFKRAETVFDVTNLRTGRKLIFRSAAKFRSVARPTAATKMASF